MNITRKTLTYGLLAVVAIAAASALLGHPVVPIDLLAGVGMVPFAMAGVTTYDDLHELLEQQNAGIKTLQDTVTEKIVRLEKFADDTSKALARQQLSGLGGIVLGGSPGPKTETWIDTKSNRPIQVLNHGDRLSQTLLQPSANSELLPSNKTDLPSMGRLMRGLALGGLAPDHEELASERKALGVSTDPAGGYTVHGAMASYFIDMLRTQMALSRAGVRTVPMESNELTIAKVTSDPTVSWHVENHALTDAAPTFGAVTLRSKTVVCRCPMSLELAQDSANIEQLIGSVMTRAMANAIDSCGINGVSVNPVNAPAGIAELADRNRVTGIGAPTTWDFVVDGMYELLADDVEMDSIGAMIAHPALWKKMRKLKTGITNDNTPLVAPEEVDKLPKLWTTAAPLTGGTTATAIIADWRDMLFGVRKDITIHVLREAYMGSNLQICILAYARVDFVATRAQSFCTLEGLTVA